MFLKRVEAFAKLTIKCVKLSSIRRGLTVFIFPPDHVRLFLRKSAVVEQFSVTKILIAEKQAPVSEAAVERLARCG
jgi:hypothetical protein